MIYEDDWRCMIQPWHHELPLWSSNLAMAKSSDCTGSNSNLLVETWGFPIASFDSQRVQVNPDFHGLDPNCWFWKQTMDGWTDRQTDRSPAPQHTPRRWRNAPQRRIPWCQGSCHLWDHVLNGGFVNTMPNSADYGWLNTYTYTYT